VKSWEKQAGVFIEYLDERIEIAKNQDLQALDELDLFGYFLEHGNLTKEKSRATVKSPIIHGYSEKIDR